MEVGAVVLDIFLRVLADNVHLADMGLGLNMAFEAVCVATLLLARLAPPPQPLKSFRLHLVGEVLGASYFGARHDGSGQDDRWLILEKFYEYTAGACDAITSLVVWTRRRV